MWVQILLGGCLIRVMRVRPILRKRTLPSLLTMTDSNFAKLRELLLNEFSEAEVTGLCQDIGLNYETLPGTGLFGKTRGLLEVAQQNGRLRALQSRLRELRPDGYAALGIGSVAAGAEMEADATPVNVSRETIGDAAQRKLPMQLLPVLLVGLVALVLVASFLWNRSIGSNAETLAAQGTQTAVAALPIPTSTTIAVIDSQVPIATQAPSVISETLAQGVSVTEPDAVVVIATEVVAVNTPLPTIAVIATAASGNAPAKEPVVVEGSGVNHPAALAFKDLNAELPAFYKGQVDNARLQEDWRGKAYAALSAFASTQLPRALQLGTTPRADMDISYEYVKEPAVIKSSGTQHTVLSREYWRYANQNAGIIRCDTRDYTYVVVAENGQYVVTDFSSKIIETGCK